MDPATERIKALLAGLTNYERSRPNAIRWSLDTMHALLRRPGARLPAGRLVQVGGSKGKGSTTAFLEALGARAGLRVGGYYSPHVSTILERVRLQERNVDEARLRTALLPVLDHVRALGVPATFFEVMTAAAVQILAEADVELGALEVGIGGRLDATTAVPVDAAIVTVVELEHTQLLGGTVEAIAGEKAHVLRPGRPGFTAVQGPALAVLEAHAARVGARLHVLGRDFAVEGVRAAQGGFAGVIRDPLGARLPFALPRAPRFLVPALALAVACLRTLHPGLELALDPAPCPSLPGRFEVLDSASDSPWVLDGAHTEGSLQALAAGLGEGFPGSRAQVLFASAADKRWREGLSALLPIADSFLVTGLTETSGEDPVEIVAWLRSRGARADTVRDAVEGVARMRRRPGLRVVTGSFYLVGAARAALGEAGSPSTKHP